MLASESWNCWFREQLPIGAWLSVGFIILSTMAKTKEELREARKQWFASMEQKLLHSRDLRNERAKLESCNIMYEMLPIILGASHLRAEKDARKLAAIALVAAGYAGDVPEDLCNALLDYRLLFQQGQMS